ncbi:hypothetical protein H0O03_04435 [Candidatus Micrarchaeota archaeon]|nr:hypothetical protein [Candidatus Micrarchaeota archaeon]
MALEFLAFLVVLALTAIPGIVLSFALLSKTALNKFEKTVIGFVIGVLAAPTLAFLEFVLLGLKLSTPLVFVNYFIVLALALGLAFRQKQLQKVAGLPKQLAEKRDWLAWTRANWAQILLLIFIVAGFYVRVGSWSTNFFEFDPYYYTFMSEQIIRFGAAPQVGEFAYYPAFEHIIRIHPIVSYMAASWYSVYASIALPAFSKDALLMAQQLYPAIVGALLAFFGYLLVKPYYGKPAGLVTAAFLAFSPQLIKKFAAGVAELQPMTVFLALALFAVFAIASENKSKRFTALVAAISFWLVLSGQQYIWPAMVMGAFILIQSVVDYWKDSLDFDKVLLNLAVAVPAFIAFALLLLYKGDSLAAMTFGLWFLLGAALLSAVLHFSSKIRLPIDEKLRKPLVIGGIVLVAVLFLAFSTFGGQFTSLVSSLTGLAGRGSPLGNTIAEENPATEAIFVGSYGILSNPPLMLLATALIISFYAALRLFEAGKIKYAAAVVVVAVLFTVFNSVFDGLIAAVVGSQPALQPLIDFVTTGDVFWYLLVTLFSVLLLQLHDQKQTRLLLLYALIIFPVAYIGLSKVKYGLHVGLVLAIVVAILLGEFNRILAALNERLKFMSASSVKWTSLAIIILIGGGLAAAQITGIPGKSPGVADSINELNSSKISSDWLLAMSWLRNNTNMYDSSIQAQCNAKFGWDCGVISWWDYGHWTNFLGETKSVLTPNNEYSNYDQEVAHGFVDGNTQDFIASMKAHHATHVLVDAQLIQKWGALVYLSGTCTPEMSSLCPPAYITDWKEGAGKSRYEAEHYFEYLQLNGQCPTAVPMPALQSSFGMTYCAGQNELTLLGRGGELVSGYRRPFVVVQDLSATQEIDENTSYLFPYSQNTFVNPNPDLSQAGLNNTLIKSVFVRLYLFENLPGFKLAYRSPHGEVKIFEIDPALLK